MAAVLVPVITGLAVSTVVTKITGNELIGAIAGGFAGFGAGGLMSSAGTAAAGTAGAEAAVGAGVEAGVGTAASAPTNSFTSFFQDLTTGVGNTFESIGQGITDGFNALGEGVEGFLGEGAPAATSGSPVTPGADLLTADPANFAVNNTASSFSAGDPLTTGPLTTQAPPGAQVATEASRTGVGAGTGAGEQSFFGKAVSWIDKNPELAKIGAGFIQGMMDDDSDDYWRSKFEYDKKMYDYKGRPANLDNANRRIDAIGNSGYMSDGKWYSQSRELGAMRGNRPFDGRRGPQSPGILTQAQRDKNRRYDR